MYLRFRKIDSKNSQSAETLKNYFPTRTFNEKLHEAIKEHENENGKDKDFLTPKSKKQKSNTINKICTKTQPYTSRKH